MVVKLSTDIIKFRLLGIGQKKKEIWENVKINSFMGIWKVQEIYNEDHWNGKGNIGWIIWEQERDWNKVIRSENVGE